MAERHQKATANFDDANGTDLVAKYGATNWINDGMEVQGNEAVGQTASTDQGVIFTDLTQLDTNIGGGTSLSDDQYAKIDVRSVTAFGIGVIVRGTTGTDDGYVGMIGGTTSTLELFRVDAGAFTSLGTHVLGTAIASGDTLAVEAEGTTIRMLHEGVERISVTDATYSSGSPGVYSFQDGAGSGDDFECGDLSHWPLTHRIRQTDPRALMARQARRAARRRIAIMGGLS